MKFESPIFRSTRGRVAQPLTIADPVNGGSRGLIYDSVRQKGAMMVALEQDSSRCHDILGQVSASGFRSTPPSLGRPKVLAPMFIR